MYKLKLSELTDHSGFSQIHHHAIRALISKGYLQNNDCWLLPGKREVTRIIYDPQGLFFLTGAPRAVKNGLTASQVIANLEYNEDFNLCVEELSRRYLS